MALSFQGYHGFSPIPTIILEVLIISWVIAFTSPNSILRLATLPLVVLCSCSILSESHHYMRPIWAALLTAISISFVLQYLDLSLLSRWNFQTRGPHPKRGLKSKTGSYASLGKSSDSPMDRMRFGLSSAFAFRHLDTPWENQNTPSFSGGWQNVPSRKSFLLWSMTAVIMCYFVIDFSTAQPIPENIEKIFSWEFVPLLSRLGDVTIQQLMLRLLCTLVYWANMYCMIQGFTSAVTVLAVGSGLSEVKSWRPLFGSPVEAYTVRRFWRYVLHSRTCLTGLGMLITESLLVISGTRRSDEYSPSLRPSLHELS